MERGYSEALWHKDLTMVVSIDDKKNITEQFKANLSTLYGGYCDIFKQMYPETNEVAVDGVKVKVDDFFKDNWRIRFHSLHHSAHTLPLSSPLSLSVEELRSRRNVLLKEIDRALREHDKKALLTSRKLALLTKEDALEAEYEEEKMKESLRPPEKRNYWIRFNVTFLKTVSTCGYQVISTSTHLTSLPSYWAYPLFRLLVAMRPMGIIVRSLLRTVSRPMPPSSPSMRRTRRVKVHPLPLLHSAPPRQAEGPGD